MSLELLHRLLAHDTHIHMANNHTPDLSASSPPLQLMLSNYSSARSRDDISQLHLEWGRWMGERVGPCERPSIGDRDASRVLRIGYLSGDLYDHVVADSIEVANGRRRRRRESRPHAWEWRLATARDGNLDRQVDRHTHTCGRKKASAPASRCRPACSLARHTWHR